MQELSLVVYLSFAFLLTMSLVGVWCASYLHRHDLTPKLCTFKISRIPILSSFVLYFFLGTVFFVLAILRPQTWASWCSAWAVAGILLFDSFFVFQQNEEPLQRVRQIVPHIRLPRQLEPLRDHRFHLVVILTESAAVIIALGVPTVTQYLTPVPVVCHALWTALWGKTWICVAKSLCQLVSVAILFWRLEAFLSLFCFSVVAYVATNGWFDYHASFPRHRSRNIQRTSHLRVDKTRIVFLGKEGVGRTELLPQLIGQEPVRNLNTSSFTSYGWPQRSDIDLLDIGPSIITTREGSDYIIKQVVRAAAAVVMVYDPCDIDSFEYIERLGKAIGEMMPESNQFRILVSNKVLEGEITVHDEAVLELESEYGWHLAISNQAKEVFRDLLFKVDS
ncbi:hypothetical protein F5X96DRAFT_13229 [Biscogniauxia mediterranea]|nr:hypothetical protein F5X96DRAFT_13229 [Biscogniauxia mediterranea]